MELSKKEKNMKKYKDILSRIDIKNGNLEELVEEKNRLELELCPIREEVNRDKY